ncbi:hypothetical protein V8C44DRAFT_198644 [Trichoderma aethiopicum]
MVKTSRSGDGLTPSGKGNGGNASSTSNCARPEGGRVGDVSCKHAREHKHKHEARSSTSGGVGPRMKLSGGDQKEGLWEGQDLKVRDQRPKRGENPEGSCSSTSVCFLGSNEEAAGGRRGQLSWLECGIEEPMQASLTSSELAQRRSQVPKQQVRGRRRGRGCRAGDVSICSGREKQQSDLKSWTGRDAKGHLS